MRQQTYFCARVYDCKYSTAPTVRQTFSNCEWGWIASSTQICTSQLGREIFQCRRGWKILPREVGKKSNEVGTLSNFGMEYDIFHSKLCGKFQNHCHDWTNIQFSWKIVKLLLVIFSIVTTIGNYPNYAHLSTLVELSG